MKLAKPLIILVAVLAIAGALGYALIAKPAAPAATFTTLEGKPIALDSLRGKIGLVNFWATSCPGCIKEMPDLIETYNQYKNKGFEIIAVAMSYDPPNYVLNFAQTRQLPFPVALDVNGAHARAFGNVQLTSISSYTYRDVLVIRDTTSLTASVTGGNIGLPASIYTLDSPLNDATTAKLFTQELRLAGARNHFQWVVGGFYGHTRRDYGQTLAQDHRSDIPCENALLAELMTLGFDPESVSDDTGSTIAFTRCPFQELAEANPELVCSLHHGLVNGFVEEFGGGEVVSFNDLAHRPPCQVEIARRSR